MAERDLTSNIGVFSTIAPAVLTATTNGAGVDLRPFNSATLVVNVGAIVGAGNMTAKMQESDDNSAWSDVAAIDTIGTALPAVLVTGTTVRIGYKGIKRYVRAVATLNSGTSVALDAIIVAGHANLAPVA